MTTNNEPVLITGGSGFVGASVARTLMGRGTPVVLLDIQPPSRLQNDDPITDIPFVLGDIVDPHVIAHARCA